MVANMSTTHLVSSAVVARRLHTSRATVTRFVREGVLTPAIRTPGSRGAFLFDEAEIEEFAKTYKNPRAKAS